MKIIRWLLGRLILTIDFLTAPKGVERSENEQQSVNSATKNLALYQFQACPFCVKVRREMKRLSLDIELRDSKNNAQYRDELLQHTGKVKAPCLRIEEANGEVTWMYESNDIIHYLQSRFALHNAAV